MRSRSSIWEFSQIRNKFQIESFTAIILSSLKQIKWIDHDRGFENAWVLTKMPSCFEKVFKFSEFLWNFQMRHLKTSSQKCLSGVRREEGAQDSEGINWVKIFEKQWRVIFRKVGNRWKFEYFLKALRHFRTYGIGLFWDFVSIQVTGDCNFLFCKLQKTVKDRMRIIL
jgi:hypothetical protein